jgi:hypothetical protein
MRFAYISILIVVFMSLVGTVTTSDSVSAASDISNIKVFQSFREEGDWLIVFLYDTDLEECDNTHVWYKRLTDTTLGFHKGTTRLPACGYRPGCIYLSASETAPMEWQGAFEIEIWGDFNPPIPPSQNLSIGLSDWSGDDLGSLDDWVVSTAKMIGGHDNGSIYTYVAMGPDGELLNTDGAAIYEIGIPGLMDVRADTLQIAGEIWVHPDWDAELGNMSYDAYLAGQWDEAVGPEIAGLWTEVGDYFGLSGRWIGIILVSIGFLFLANWCKTIAFGILLSGTVIGIFPLWFLGVLAFVLLIIFLKSFVLSST